METQTNSHGEQTPASGEGLYTIVQKCTLLYHLDVKGLV